MNDARRLTRSRTDRMISGVCGGLGAYFGADPVLFRVAFVVLALAGGGGIVLYLLLTLVVPSVDAPETGPRETAQRGVDDLGARTREVTDDLRGPPRRQRNTAGVLLIVLGAVLLVHEAGGFWWLSSGIVWAILLIAAGAWLLYRQRRAP